MINHLSYRILLISIYHIFVKIILVIIVEEYLNQLNSVQKDAVIYNEGPSLVIAGAGSGKTRVLTYKIAGLLKQGISEEHTSELQSPSQISDSVFCLNKSQ